MKTLNVSDILPPATLLPTKQARRQVFSNQSPRHASPPLRTVLKPKTNPNPEFVSTVTNKFVRTVGGGFGHHSPKRQD